MDKLDLKVKSNGREYVQVKRDSYKAMYRCGDIVEVFRIKVSKASEMFGKEYPEREVYPGVNDFGSTAWCYYNNDIKAELKYDSIKPKKKIEDSLNKTSIIHE